MAPPRRRRLHALLVPCLALLSSATPSAVLREQPHPGALATAEAVSTGGLPGRNAGGRPVPEPGGNPRTTLTTPSVRTDVPNGLSDDDHDSGTNSTPGATPPQPPAKWWRRDDTTEESTAVPDAATTPRPTPPPLPPLLHVLLRTTTPKWNPTTHRRRPLPLPPLLGITQSPSKTWYPPGRGNQQHGSGSKPRSGPYFEEGAKGSNVTARLGSNVLLDCKIGMLRDKTVTWLHRKGDAIHLLTVGRQAYSSDSRFSLAYRYPNNWRLQILFVSRRDEGFYECQVATHPPRIRQIFLRVTAPEVKIVDEDYHEVLERYYKAGSQVELTCVASQLERGDGVEEPEAGGTGGASGHSTETPPEDGTAAGRVLWRHGEAAITHNSSSRAIWMNTSADGQNATVTLTLRSTKKSDGGNYTCSVGSLASATVSIHILNGELPAAVQYGNSSVPFGAVSILLQLWCLVVSLSAINR